VRRALIRQERCVKSKKESTDPVFLLMRVIRGSKRFGRRELHGACFGVTAFNRGLVDF
jgi:hypothetical protein